MLTYKTYKQAQSNLDQLCNQVVESQNVVILEREDGKNVALIAADELSSMEETIYLLSSPANAACLYAALDQAKARTVKPQTIDELFEELESDSHDFAVGEILEAKVTRIKGNKVTYEILGSVKITKNEPKKARDISEGQTVKVEIVDIAEDGTINKVKCVS
ncbi:type II toxin-antitoxin system Phd/YefM family antitoxin [Microcoleus sp. D2_18a_D3]|uniref:type II toxin-antitoxin system Phd/YefM family antitoxin n=1 Tax=Microcoleus sp. D2_18a_D3 TaxID=3055330 RepID=UPI002FD7533E